MFNYFKSDEKLVINTKLPKFCEDYYKNGNKKCKSFYIDSLTESVTSILKCPYGFNCYRTENTIFTNLLVTGAYDYNKVNEHLRAHNEKLSEFTIFTKKDITFYINEYLKNKTIIESNDFLIHDLRNASTHFVDLSDMIKREAKFAKTLEYDEIYSAVEGYSLINYILRYHSKILNYTIDDIRYNLVPYPMLHKLVKLLISRASKKDVEIKVQGPNNNAFLITSDVYLGFYILIENAIKYSIPNTKIEIKALDITDKYTEIMISNYTTSVCKEDIPYLIIKGYRSNLASSSKGSGLGLNLAERIFRDSGLKLSFNLVENIDCVSFISRVTLIRE